MIPTMTRPSTTDAIKTDVKAAKSSTSKYKQLLPEFGQTQPQVYHEPSDSPGGNSNTHESFNGNNNPRTSAKSLAQLCSNSFGEICQKMKSLRQLNGDFKLETAVSMGVAKEEFDEWHGVLKEDGNFIPTYSDQRDPFFTSVLLSLIEECALLEEIELSVSKAGYTSLGWQKAHQAINQYYKSGKTDDLICYSDDEGSDKERETPEPEAGAAGRPNSLAKALARHGLPIVPREYPLETKLHNLIRNQASLDVFTPGLRLRLYMSRHGSGSQPAINSTSEPNGKERFSQEEISRRLDEYSPDSEEYFTD